MKSFKRYALALATAAASLTSANAVGWPANYEGVMLQGFGWNTYTDTKWTNLESQADELSQYFKLIWIPNSGYCGSGNNMGYMPQYWFTNHNSSFGTEAQLISMINTFKAKGTGFIADVVINHRNGVTNWTDFPKEEWNGQTWFIGTEGICNTDEVNNASGQARATGAADTGEDFNGARDLDHTNANVQNNCKNYCKCLLEKYGYAGFRYDMVKGYSGYYTKIYNQYSKPTYSVGEYWDGNYDAVAAWIEATGKESAAFDFPGKYAINEAFSSGDMTKLVWKANGTTNQPAGMIHFGYPQYSVTFVDNHDTYRDGSAFNGNVVAANAFILCSPGTPCVFLPHWKQYKAAIKDLIAVRNAVGVSNTSKVTVLKSTNNCYMAEVTGSKGKLVVKIGSAMDSPSGYSNSDIKASGNDYCVWSKTEVIGGGGGDDPVVTTSSLYILGNLEGTAGWSTTPGTGMAMTKNGDVYTAKNVKFVAATGETKCYFNLTDYVGSTWDDLNMGANRYGAATEGAAVTLGTPATIVKYANNVDASGCLSWTLPAGTYDITADLSTMKLTVASAGQGGGDDPVIIPDDDEHYIYFDGTSFSQPQVWAWNDGGNCTTATAWPGDNMTKKDNKWYWAVPAGKSLPTEVIIHEGDNKIGGGDLAYVDHATYHQDGSYTTEGGGDDPIIPQLEVNIYFDNTNSNWTTPHIHYWGGSESTWPGVAMTKVEGNIWHYTCPGGTTGLLFNAGDGDATKTGDFVAINNHVYNTSGDQGEYQGGGDDPINDNYPANIYMVGNINDNPWATAHGLKPDSAADGVYTWKSVNFNAASTTQPTAYFTFLTALDAADGDWNGANQGDRYGAATEGEEVTVGTPANVVLYKNQVDAMAAKSWTVTPGVYKTELRLPSMSLVLTKTSVGVEMVIGEETTVAPEYYNLMGVRVDNPSTGVYIVRRGDKVTKEYVK